MIMPPPRDLLRDMFNGWIIKNAVQLALLLIGLGVAYRGVTNELSQKADKVTVAINTANIERKADRETVAAMARDIQTIKILMCSAKGADSFCSCG